MMSSDNDDDDEYEPLVPSSAALADYLAKAKEELKLARKVWPFSCYFCPTRKFKDSTAVHSHNKRHHKDVCQQYSFRKWKCRKCNSKLTSLNIRGLMAHVHENRCSSRRKHLSDSVEAQIKFLSNFQLVPISQIARKGEKSKGTKSRACNRVSCQENLVHPNFSCSTNFKLYHDMDQAEAGDHMHTAQENETTPIKLSRHDQKSTTHRALRKTNTNIQRNIADSYEMRKKPKPKPLNLDAEVFCTSFLNSKRPSASKAYEKLCPKTLRRYKRQLNKLSRSTEKTASEVHTTVGENGRIVLRCEPSYWSKIKNGNIYSNN